VRLPKTGYGSISFAAGEAGNRRKTETVFSPSFDPDFTLGALGESLAASINN
jgi:hypothetical protein